MKKVAKVTIGLGVVLVTGSLIFLSRPIEEETSRGKVPSVSVDLPLPKPDSSGDVAWGSLFLPEIEAGASVGDDGDGRKRAALNLKRLEILFEGGGDDFSFRKNLLALLTEGSFESREHVYDLAFRSSISAIRDVAKAFYFSDLVEQNGFNKALDDFEGKLVDTLSDPDDLLDFVVNEAASYDPAATLEWARVQGDDVWSEAIPLIISDWSADDSYQVEQWLGNISEGAFRDRAIAEYASTLELKDSEKWVDSIEDENVRQEAKIRTGIVSFSVLGKTP